MAGALSLMGREAPADVLNQLGTTSQDGLLAGMPEMLRAGIAPQDDKTQWLSFAAGMGAPTKTGALTEALGNAAGAQADARTKHQQLQAQYIPLITGLMQQQQAAAQAKMVERVLREAFGDDAAAAPGAGAPGAPGAMLGGQAPAAGALSAGQPPQAGAQPGAAQAPAAGSRIGNMSLDQVARVNASMKMLGLPEITPLWELGKFGKEMQPGYRRNADGTVSYFGDPSKRITLGPNGEIRPMTGAEIPGQLAAADEAAKTTAVETAKAPFTLVEGYDPASKTPVKVPLSTVLGGQPAPGKAPAGAATPASAAPGARAGAAADSDQAQILTAELAKRQEMLADPGKFMSPADLAADPGGVKFKQRLQTDIDSIQREAKRGGVALPSGGLATGPSAGAKAVDEANAKFLGKRADAASDYATGLDDRVHQGGDLNLRLQESLDAMSKFKAGGGKETRAKLASMAQGAGLPDTMVNRIAGGDLAAMQEFNKLAVQQAMEQLKSSMGNAGRIAQAEFKVFQANNPNLSTDDNAIRKIFDFNTKLFNRDLAEQKAFQDHVKAGSNPAEFQAKWAEEQTKRGFTDPTLAAQPALALPKDPSPANLVRGRAYTLPNGASATWDGEKFKGK